jgi:hypothetical protein
MMENPQKPKHLCRGIWYVTLWGASVRAGAALRCHWCVARMRATRRIACFVRTRLPVNCPLLIFIHFLVRLAFRPSRGAPNAHQLATTIASSSTALAPTPHRQRWRPLDAPSEKHTKLAHEKLDQLQSFIAVFLQERTGQPAVLGPT